MANAIFPKCHRLCSPFEDYQKQTRKNNPSILGLNVHVGREFIFFAFLFNIASALGINQTSHFARRFRAANMITRVEWATFRPTGSISVTQLERITKKKQRFPISHRSRRSSITEGFTARQEGDTPFADLPVLAQKTRLDGIFPSPSDRWTLTLCSRFCDFHLLTASTEFSLNKTATVEEQIVLERKTPNSRGVESTESCLQFQRNAVDFVS